MHKSAEMGNRLLPDRLRSPGPAQEPEKLGDDLLYGAKAIQEELKLRSVRQVYHLREKGAAPIFEMAGVGLVARKSALRAWIKRLEDAVANSNDRP